MSTKEEVLNLLNSNRGRFISGQEIAGQLNVSRAAVWKAIKSLESAGFGIEAVTNKGYRLNDKADIINASYIEVILRDRGIDIRVVYKDETGSTNEDAVELLRESDRPVLVIADKQNKGRGRKGRDFYSPKGTGLYMSLAIRDALTLMKTAKVTAVAAVAVSEAIDSIVFKGENHSLIKWVNDIYVDEKKVCGILSEAMISMEDGDGGVVVVGMGINVYEPAGGFPEDISKKAGYLIGHEQKSNVYNNLLRSDLGAEVVRKFFHYINEPEASLRIYREKSNLIGKHILVNSFVPGDKRSGSRALVTGIDDECRLLIEYEDGNEETLSSGEVSVVLG
jgi:BirA family biotin operon repressor/biotin-[acetyl-CoA-carboxylase] ligase